MTTATKEQLKTRLHDLEREIGAIRIKLKLLGDERNAVAADEAILRAKTKEIRDRRYKITNDPRFRELVEERASCLGLLEAMADTAPVG